MEEQILQERVVALFVADPFLRDSLSAAFSYVDFRAYVIPDFAGLKKFLINTPPTVLIIDAVYLTSSCLSFLRDHAQQLSFLSLYCLADNDDVATRLIAVKAGAVAFFRKPITVSLLVKQIEQQFVRLPIPIKLLYVTNVAHSKTIALSALKQAGIEVTVITDPLRLCDVMAEFYPDIVFFDRELPCYSAQELMALLRQENAYSNVPFIVTLPKKEVSENNKKSGMSKIENTYFLKEPMTAAQLVAVVRDCYMRAGLPGAYMKRDVLTGLLNHSSIRQHVEFLVAMAHESDVPLALILIDIDYLQQVNNLYGYPVGDVVIRRLATLLLQQMRGRDDLAGRLAGEKFLLLLPDTNAKEAQKFCRRLREQFSQLSFSAAEQIFQMTFSAGIATDSELHPVEAAKIALRHAKQAGGNCERLAESSLLAD